MPLHADFRREAHLHRRQRLLAEMAKRGIDRALIAAGTAASRNYPANQYPFRASSHFLYLVGVAFEGAVLRLEDGQAVLHLPKPPEDDALWHGETPSFDALSEALGLPIETTEQLPQGNAATLPCIRSTLASALGRDPSVPSDADRLLQQAIIELRLRHDNAAIAGLKRAAEATVAAHRAGMAATAPKRSEAEVRAAMEAALRRRGMGTAYAPIVTTRGEVLHNPYQRFILEAGDLLLADVGAETEGGWAGDVTRTWPVSGSFTTAQRQLYDLVHRAHQNAIAKVAPGVRYRDVHLEACRTLTAGLVDLGVLLGDPDELLAEGVHALFFPHGVGHLIGLDVHDMEDLGDLAGYGPGFSRSEQFGLGYLRLDRILEAGMAVTIEPGLYRVGAILEGAAFEGLRRHLAPGGLKIFEEVRGIRVEDDVLVTADGHSVLTAALPSDAASIEGLVGA